MEHFDIKLDCFDGLNLPQRQLSLSKPNFRDLFSLLNLKKTKKREK
jgi:hypothetical protein